MGKPDFKKNIYSIAHFSPVLLDISITWNKKPVCKTQESTMSLSYESSYYNLNCNGVSSCQELKVEENIWSIKCSQTSSCRGITARCASGKSCRTTCDGTSACRNGKFYGKWSTVDCKGTSTCRDLTIEESENVKCTGTSSCRGTVLLNWKKVQFQKCNNTFFAISKMAKKSILAKE